MIFPTDRIEHRIGKAVVMPEEYSLCIARYFSDGGLLFCREYFHAKKHITVQTPWVIYQYWVHGFSLYFLVSKKSADSSDNSDNGAQKIFYHAHDGSFVVRLRFGNNNRTTKEPGTYCFTLMRGDDQ